MATKKKITRPLRKKPSRPGTGATGTVSPSSAEAAPAFLVGIGASAGGLEAFTQLLRALPADTGMAFVLVQHLDPMHESILAELLARATTMPVHEVTDGIAPEPDHVYVIPRRRDMMLSQGALKLLPRSEGRVQHMPIDFFFMSLAKEMGGRAIGVILSGSASDGTLGIKAIKAEGGITFAQDEKSAKYDGMPRAAVASGSVDRVLPPEKIAAELARIGRHPVLSEPRDARAEEITPEEGDGFSRILNLLHKATGIDFTYYKQSTIKRRIGRRMIVQTMQGIDAYVSYLQKHPSEAEALAQDILIHVTGFFRDPETFRVLKRKVFPKIAKKGTAHTPIRIWVPGCSTGEEAYSIAIALLEHLAELKDSPPVQIFATDVSEPAVEKARVGTYGPNISSEVSAERLRRFFTKLEVGNYQISKSVRDLCIFARQDVTKDPPFSNIDLISCRNLLIYLGPMLQKKVLAVLHYAMRTTGFLLLGSSESTSGFGELFFSVDKKHKIFGKRPMATRLYMDHAQGQYLIERPEPEPLSRGGAGRIPDIQREVDRVLLGKYAPPAVLVNEALDILQFRGRTSGYLEPAAGEASLNLARMAREGLMIEISTAIHRAKKEGAAIRKENVRFQHNRHSQEMNLEVVPIRAGKGLNFLILFEDAGRRAAAEPAPTKRIEKKIPGKAKGKGDGDHAVRLKQELDATKEYLQAVVESQETTNEELRSAYEEIQSSNEELQSTNEELETAKEELQSTNEELTTVNETLQIKNFELGQLNNDLNNLLASANIPIVMVGSDLRIRRFTPMAEKVLNLIPSDVGRPLGNIKPNINVPDLERLIAEVIETLRLKEMEVQDHDGHWYALRLRPYRTIDNRIDGAVLALVDIDTVKATMEEIKAARDHAEAIVDTVRQPILMLAQDLSVKQANRAYCQTFGTTPGQTVGHFLYELGNGQWNEPRLRLMLQEVLPKDSRFDDFEVARDFEGIGRRIMLLAGRRLRAVRGHSEQILLAITDVTDRREAAETRYRQLFGTVQEGVLILDEVTQHIAEANPGALRLLDRPREELLGRRFREVLAADQVERWRGVMSALQTEDQARIADLEIMSDHGEAITVDCICNAYLEAGQRMVQCVIVGSSK